MNELNKIGGMPTTEYEQQLLENLSKQVQRRRTAKGWTQPELAEKLQMNVSTVRKIEGMTLEERPRPRTLKALADALECSVEDLFEPLDKLPGQKTIDKSAEKPQNGHLSDLLIEQTKKLGVKEEENRKLVQRNAELEAKIRDLETEIKRLQK